MCPKRLGPGLVKSRQAAPTEPPTRRMVLCADYLWRDCFEKADVVSEGAVRIENARAIYYGSTHIRLTLPTRDDPTPSEPALSPLRLAQLDPHVRLRAIRIACREAQLRSLSQLQSMRAELSLASEGNRLTIDIDVEAPVAPSTALGTSGATNRNVK